MVVGGSFFLLRALWCERCTGVLKCLSLFSWQSFFCVWAFSQFLGAPRECISTDGGFNWSVGFKKKKKEKKKRKKSGLYAVFVAGYFNLFVCLVCFCLLMCCCFVFFFPEG